MNEKSHNGRDEIKTQVSLIPKFMGSHYPHWNLTGNRKSDPLHHDQAPPTSPFESTHNIHVLGTALLLPMSSLSARNSYLPCKLRLHFILQNYSQGKHSIHWLWCKQSGLTAISRGFSWAQDTGFREWQKPHCNSAQEKNSWKSEQAGLFLVLGQPSFFCRYLWANNTTNNLCAGQDMDNK